MDFFLTNRPLQPKLEIGNYVVSMGGSVPERYTSFDAALHSGAAFIMRSEHPQDYDGASGLLNSFTIEEELLRKARDYVPREEDTTRPSYEKNLDDLLAGLNRKLLGGTDRELELVVGLTTRDFIQDYCHYLGFQETAFLSQLSYSYWRLMGGLNRSIVADSAIRGRYHVFTATPDEPDSGHNYTIVDGRKIVLSDGYGLPTEAIHQGISTAIDFYEFIRRLPRFDPNHCPIIECQWVDGIHHFLQYHRCRDFQPPGFELSRQPEEGEIEALLVRGATPPEGIVVNTAFYYPFNKKGRWALEEQEDASFDFHYQVVFSEIMARRRKVNFVDRKRLLGIASANVTNHLTRSKLFKPQVTVVAPFDKHLPASANSYRKTKEEKKPFRIPIRVVSDGRRALVKLES